MAPLFHIINGLPPGRGIKRIYMRKKRFTIWATAICVLVVFLTAWKNVSDNPKTPIIKMGDAVRADSVAITHLGEEEAAIVFSQSKATLYHLDPGTEAKDSEMRIGGVRVKGKMGIVSEKNLSPLLFMLSDSCFLSRSEEVVTTPYAPTYALRFKGRKGIVDLVFSLTSNQMSVVRDGAVKKTFDYSPSRDVIRYFRNVSGNEFYDKLLTTNNTK